MRVAQNQGPHFRASTGEQIAFGCTVYKGTTHFGNAYAAASLGGDLKTVPTQLMRFVRSQPCKISLISGTLIGHEGS